MVDRARELPPPEVVTYRREELELPVVLTQAQSFEEVP